MRPFLSLDHFTAIDADPLTLIRVAARQGFNGVGLRVERPPGAVETVDVAGNAALRREINKELAATGLRILDVGVVWLQADSDVKAFLPALDTGAELGARNVIVCGSDPERARLASNFSRLCEQTDARGLRAMLEFLPYTHIRTLKEAHDLLREVAPADAGILVDALHLSRSGGMPADLADYDPLLFPYYHLCDAPADPPSPDELVVESRGGRLYPGEGQLWLRDFVAAFALGTAAAIEAPSTRHSGQSIEERARLAAEACGRLFDIR